MKTGLVFILHFGLIVNLCKSADIFPYKYLILPYGSCIKCSGPISLLSQIKDEYKPVILFSDNEKSIYKANLIRNNLSHWPENKIMFSDSKKSKLKADTFGIFYFSTNDSIFQYLKLDLLINTKLLELLYTEVHKEIFEVDTTVLLGNELYYSVNNNSKVLSVKDVKTIYVFDKFSNLKYSIILNEDLICKISLSENSDTGYIAQFIDARNKLVKYNMDPSEFGSIDFHNDTLITIANIGTLRKFNDRYIIWRDQYVCFFFNGLLIRSYPIEFKKEKITYDEYVSGKDIKYLNETLYVRSNRYNSKDLLIGRNSIAKFVLNQRAKRFERIAFLKVNLPERLILKSHDFIDYTIGGFYQFDKQPNYYFTHDCSVYENYVNSSYCVVDTNVKSGNSYVQSLTTKGNITFISTADKDVTNVYCSDKRVAIKLFTIPSSVGIYASFLESGISILNPNTRLITNYYFTLKDFIKN